MTTPLVLVAGIGNIFLGDDGFGSEVAQRLLGRARLPDVRVVDFGIRGLDLAYALIDGCDTAILIDAVPRGGGPPGTLYLLEPQLEQLDCLPPVIEAHSMDPVKVLRTAAALGATPRQVFIIGCEPTPADFDNGDAPMGLSPAVQAAVDPAVAMVESLAEKICRQLSLELRESSLQET